MQKAIDVRATRPATRCRSAAIPCQRWPHAVGVPVALFTVVPGVAEPVGGYEHVEQRLAVGHPA